MAHFILRLCLYFVGIAGVVIGGSFILFGVDMTGQFFKAVIDTIFDSGELTGLRNPNADSELSFYSVFWVAYGVLLIKAANDIERYQARIPWLIGLFFAGGIARLISYIRIGEPHPLFMLLMAIELGLPIIVILVFWRRKASV